MPGLVPGIHAFLHINKKDVDGRDKPGHDESSRQPLAFSPYAEPLPCNTPPTT